MTMRPDPGTIAFCARLLLLPLALAHGISRAQEVPLLPELYPVQTELEDNWYRTEVLIFARTDDNTLASEQWDPLPRLAYPETYRYLIDPELVERRLAQSSAEASRIDPRGFQTLVMPAPITPFDDAARPDALLVPLPEDPLPGVADPNAPQAIAATPDDAAPVRELPTQLLAQPYQLLDRSEHEFSDQARTLRRRGHRILFHGSWWSRLDNEDESLPVVIDHSADPDLSAWPGLQGSIHLYRSRYLHISLDLWLNTMGAYLPAGWQIDAPPRPLPSLNARTRSGQALTPWSDTAPMDPASLFLPPEPLPGELAAFGATPVTPEEELEADFPWRHAIVHRQSRRMRSGEIHYLDHPVIGVIVRVVPAGDEYMPLVPADDEVPALDFRARHELPAIYLELPADDNRP